MDRTKVYLAFDERMLLHRPLAGKGGGMEPQEAEDAEDAQRAKQAQQLLRQLEREVEREDHRHPDFTHERPARAYAVYKSLQRLDKRLRRRYGSCLEQRQSCSLQHLPVEYHEAVHRRFVPVSCPIAAKETVCLVHSEDYYDRFKMTSTMKRRELMRLNARDADLYYCEDTFEAASVAVGGCVECVNAVTSAMAESKRAVAVVRPPGT